MSDCCNEVIVTQVSLAVVTETDSPNSVVVEETSSAIVQNTLSEAVVHSTNSTPSITVSQVGVQGPPGPPGTGGYSEVVAGEDISVYQVIVIGSDGLAYIADPTDINDFGLTLGVAIQSASASGTLQYVSTGTISGGSWVEGAKYFVGPNGSLSTTPRAVSAQWLQFIGVGKTSNSFNIALGQPVRTG